MKQHWRIVAGNLELFLGAYFMGFGFLGLIFFTNRDGIFGSAAAIVIGLMVLLRARQLLDWHGAFFWLVALLAVSVPVGLLLRAVLRAR